MLTAQQIQQLQQDIDALIAAATQLQSDLTSAEVNVGATANAPVLSALSTDLTTLQTEITSMQTTASGLKLIVASPDGITAKPGLGAITDMTGAVDATFAGSGVICYVRR